MPSTFRDRAQMPTPRYPGTCQKSDMSKNLKSSIRVENFVFPKTKVSDTLVQLAKAPIPPYVKSILSYPPKNSIFEKSILMGKFVFQCKIINVLSPRILPPPNTLYAPKMRPSCHSSPTQGACFRLPLQGALPSY